MLMRHVLEGLRFVRSQPLILSTMLLDFFATFFSSATALLPIFAREILGVGAIGYGWLVAAFYEARGLSLQSLRLPGALLLLRRGVQQDGRDPLRPHRRRDQIRIGSGFSLTCPGEECG